MSECQFEHIVVIGYGIVTGEVLKTVHELALRYGYTDEYIEYEVHPFNTAKKYADTEGIKHNTIEDKKELTNYFEEVLKEKTLIISASNNYLFPARIVLNDNATIINFHNALLPELPGRNAPSWAIYEGKEYTGITWHYVTEGVDAGDIIIQKKCQITANIKAYELVAVQMRMAGEAFSECYESVLMDCATRNKQVVEPGRRLYRSCEVPGNGCFNLKDSPEKIYRLLRALDYGKNDIFPLVRTQKDGIDIQIRRYKIVSVADIDERTDRIYIPYDNESQLMLRYETIDESGKIGGGIDSLEHLYQMIAELKSVKRRLTTNMLMDDESLQNLVDCDELRFEYYKQRYISLWYKEWNYCRLFFYITELADYNIPNLKSPIVCDLIFSKEDEKNRLLVEKLQIEGLHRYAKYHKWIRGYKTTPKLQPLSGVDVTNGCGTGFYSLLKDSFDIYSDYVPEHDKFDIYIKNKIIISVINQEKTELVGGLVITVKGDVQTEEFVFTKPCMQGNGVASYIHRIWYCRNQNPNGKYVAWIRDDNDASISLHRKYDYEMQNTYKITMVKEIK